MVLRNSCVFMVETGYHNQSKAMLLVLGQELTLSPNYTPIAKIDVMIVVRI